jgi:DNA repair protein RadD
MTFTLATHLWPPQRRGLEQTITMLDDGKDLCLYGPTGSGKTVQASELARWATYQGMGTCFYVNRKLLVSQTLDRFRAAGLDVAVRAAEYEDQYDPHAKVQICSADTERARVMGDKAVWNFHDAGLVIVDESHIQKADTMQKIVAAHRAKGARIVLLTATPIGISHMVNDLVISGTMQEYRDCKALVLATVRSIEQPDMSKVKRNETGEFILDGQKKKIYTQSIIANVLDRWKRYNPDARPTMAYWPGKPESAWGTKQFTDIGVPFCHVDAVDAVLPEWKVLAGVRTLVARRTKLTRTLWQEILDKYRAGEITGLSSRFKLREGIDVPFTYHVILATPIGSMASFVQTVGRVLRYSPETPDGVIITDHGGNYWRHGSPNADRPWREWWTMSEGHISQMKERGIKEHGEKEPIRCPQCEGERLGGSKCPHCGFEHPKSQRHVRYEDGTMKVVDGPLIKPTRTQLRDTTADDWARMFWGFRKKKVGQTFAQMEAYFTHTHGYHPRRDVPFMPKNKETWVQVVHKVDFKDLTVPSSWNADTVSAKKENAECPTKPLLPGFESAHTPTPTVSP